MSSIGYSPSVIGSVRTARAPRRTSTVRLTRRGRLVVLVLGLLVALAIGIAFASTSAAGNHAGTPDVHVITVQAGDTLWDIAGDAAPAAGVTTGEMVQRLEELNPLEDGMVYVGQQLRVPND